MNYRENRLFSDRSLDDLLENQRQLVTDTVKSIPNNQFLSTPEHDLIDHVCAKLYIEPLTLLEESMEMDQKEREIDVSGRRGRNPFGDSGPINVPGIEIIVSIPFTGDSNLWYVRPNKWQSVSPSAVIESSRREDSGELKLVYQEPSDAPPEQIKRRFDQDLDTIRFYLTAQREQIERFNDALPERINKEVHERQCRLEKHEGISQHLDIPLKRREGAPSVKPIKVERRLARPLPQPSASGFNPEPGIDDKVYEHILQVIRHVGRTFESTPATYRVHGEESLRDILLANLNGHYHGEATGETFRRKGKTDIRIEDDERAAFVAECKVWSGKNDLLEAIDQLVGYLTWRDCKASLVIFNKHNSRFSELLTKIPEIMRSHKNHKHDLGQQGAGEWRFLFASPGDELREITVNVSVFNIHMSDR